MPMRRDEWVRTRSKEDLRYCVICQRYMPPVEWDAHQHNPKVNPPERDILQELDDLTSDVLYLGGMKVANCASVLVVQGVEVFRLRDRDRENNIRVDLDVRGPAGRLAKVTDNNARFLAPGYRFVAHGPECSVVHEASGEDIVRVESLSSKSTRILGTFWADGLRVAIGEDAVAIGEAVIPAQQVRGTGTAVLLRSKGPQISFAKR